MTKSEIQSALHDLILRQFPAARTRGLRVDDSLLEQGIIDSLGVLEIVGFIEQHFGITLTDDEMVSDHFKSIPNPAEMVHQKVISEKSAVEVAQPLNT